MKPLEPAAAKVRVKEVLEFLVREEAKLFVTVKRSANDAELEANEDSSKRARTKPPIASINFGPEVTDAEISAIAAEATLEVSVSP